MVKPLFVPASIFWLCRRGAMEELNRIFGAKRVENIILSEDIFCDLLLSRNKLDYEGTNIAALMRLG